LLADRRTVRAIAIAGRRAASAIYASFVDLGHHRWAIGALLGGCIWLYGGFILRTYAGADFPPAVSYALNFQIALDHGQLPPRMVEFPREFQLGMGTVDHTPPTPDAPVFQYYAFLPSALAYPWLSFGIKGPEALGWVILSTFAIGAICLYLTALLLGARRNLALLAAWSYLVSPWLISNIYGRGGVAEGVSHALLPLLGLGIACAWTGRHRAAIIATATGIAGLALAHNIFLLHGALFCGLVISCEGIFFVVALWRKTGGKPATHLARGANLAVGLGLGLAVSSWQWMPAYMAVGDTSFAGQVANTYVQDFASWSGIVGFPKTYSYGGSQTPFFFTIGWWSIPSLMLAVWLTPAGRRSRAVALAGVFIAYFVLTYAPGFGYALLPSAFNATQVTFRTLAFLSFAGALALALVRLQPGWITTLALLFAMTASQLAVIYYPEPVFRYTDDQYLKGWEVNAFHAYPRYLSSTFRVRGDGGLISENIIHLASWRDETGAKSRPVGLRMIGQTMKKIEKPFQLWLGPIDQEPDDIPGNAVSVDSDRFDVTVPIPESPDDLRVFFTGSIASGAMAAIYLERAYLTEKPAASYVYSDALMRTEATGLRRTFGILPERLRDFSPAPSNGYVVEIPMVYNRFLVARQDDGPLKSWVDFNYRLNVRVPDLARPIVVAYEIPQPIWWLSAAGLAALMLVMMSGGAKSLSRFDRRLGDPSGAGPR